MNIRGKIFFISFLLLCIRSLSLSQSVDASLVIASFKQGRVKQLNPELNDGNLGNCAAVAIIKSAIATYGLSSVFQQVKKDDLGYVITFRDNSIPLRISIDELAMGKARSFFIGVNNDDLSASLLDYAIFCFAVLCKKRQEKNESYSDAIDKVNAGLSTRQAYKYLGLKKVTQSKKIKDLKEMSNAVIWNGFHGAFASKGIYDEYGKVEDLGKFDNKHGTFLKPRKSKIKGAYTLL